MGNIFAEIEKIVKLREDIKTLSKDAQSELLYWLFLFLFFFDVGISLFFAFLFGIIFFKYSQEKYR